MPIGNPELTIADFEEANWEDVIASCASKTFHDYSTAFLNKANEADKAGSVGHAKVFQVLGQLTSMMLRLDNPSEPFRALMQLGDSRSAMPDDFTENQLSLFAELLPGIADPEMQARVGDILWVTKKNYKAAQIAVEAYLASARALEDPIRWPPVSDRIERALRISRQLGRDSSALQAVVTQVKEALGRFDGTDQGFLTARLLSLLYEVSRDSPERYAALAEKGARLAEADGNFHRARSYWEVGVSWCRAAKDNDALKRMQISIAETYSLEADAALGRATPSSLAAAHFVEKAIQAFRDVGSQQERIETLHTRLLALQASSVKELVRVEVPFDGAELANHAMGRVRGLKFQEALMAFIALSRPPRLATLREQVTKAADEHPMRHLFNGALINSSGKVVERKLSVLSSDGEERETAIRQHMYEHASTGRIVTVVGFIEPARQQIVADHNPRAWDILQAIAHNPFVPKGRELLYARGLHAGFEGDYAVAIHLLLPQFEHSLRVQLTNRGVVTSAINKDGIQDEMSLNALLELPESTDIFGEDLLFDINGLLVEREGGNLRNLLAHGLLEQDAFASPPAIYAWWLILYLVLFPHSQAEK